MISEEIFEKAGKTGYKNTDWYTNSLMNALQEYQNKNFNQFDTNFIIPGDLVFFMYSAKYAQKYMFWDQHPLVYVMEVSPSQGLFFGANVHYLNPSYRKGVTESLLNKKGDGYAPRKTLKKYLFANVVTDLYKVPEDDWGGVSLLPTESFRNKLGQRISKEQVWDYPDSLSSP